MEISHLRLQNKIKGITTTEAFVNVIKCSLITTIIENALSRKITSNKGAQKNLASFNTLKMKNKKPDACNVSWFIVFFVCLVPYRKKHISSNYDFLSSVCSKTVYFICFFYI